MRFARIALMSTSFAFVPVMVGVGQAQVSVPSVTTADPGYLFPNDRYQRQREQQRPSRQAQQSPRNDAPVQLDEAAKARVRERVRGLTPEYHRRVARDGQAAADAWIRERGFEIGQDEGRRARQRQSGR